MACKKCKFFVDQGTMDGGKYWSKFIKAFHVTTSTSYSGGCVAMGIAVCKRCKARVQYTDEELIHHKLWLTYIEVKEELKIATIQADLLWEDVAANLEQFEAKIKEIKEQVDIIVLPEMFNTGFSMNAEKLAEPMNGKTIEWMKNQAKKTKAILVGSLIIEEKEKYYNRMVCVNGASCIEQYDKHHLFSMAKEDKIFKGGNKQVVWDYKGWLIGLFVCYDLRFPVWNRNQAGYDAAIYVANWPAKRSFHWRSLLTARAIENQAYIVAVNRVGQDGNGYPYSGDSTVLDPAGDLLYHKEDVEDVVIHSLTQKHLKEVREQYPFLDDKDTFEIKIR